MKRSNLILLAIIILASGIGLGMSIESASQRDAFQQLKKLEDAFTVISRRYVEDVNPEELSQAAIEGMLEDLDPHSVYIDSKSMGRVREEYDGSFEGIGLWFEMLRDTVHITATIADGPSESVGLLAGDRIIAVDGESVVGLESDQVVKHLKGPKGTHVIATILRDGVGTLDFDIIRDKIPLFTVNSAYMMDDQTGYIQVGRFAKTTHQEVHDHLIDLKTQGMERLILDLRGNPGGIMQGAVGIADEFLGQGETIVSTKSRHADFNWEYDGRDGDLFETQPLIVLIDQGSASASEIVAGALQDHDRALLVGQKSFGKGLVQQQFPLTDGSVLQMTISRYYTPSGRLIQTPYEEGHDAYYQSKYDNSLVDAASYASSVPDSLRYTTSGGRTVFGGGGILPDYIVQRDSVSLVVRTIINLGLDIQFMREYTDKHRSLREDWAGRQDDFVNKYIVEDALWNEFWQFVNENENVIITTSGESRIDEENSKIYLTQSDIDENRDVAAIRLKGHLARRLYSFSAWFPVTNSLDQGIIEANKLWDEATELAAQTP